MTSPDGQIAMPFSEARDRQRRSLWLGLATDHRRLFGALADGWLRPLQSRAGVLIGVGAYAVEPSDAPGGHPIAVRIRLDAAKLPTLAVSVRRGERWVSSRLGEIEATDAALYWPGALPAFAFSGISVSTEEERRRLEGLARSVSNVDLAATTLGLDADAEGTIEPDALPEVSRTFVIPEDEDAIHGAMSMAVWAVPRIDPWLDVLTASLASDRARLPEVATGVEAGWWRFPPWMRPSDDPPPAGVDECLWRAAVDVLRERSAERPIGPRDNAEGIAAEALRLGGRSAESDAISTWLHDTHRILRAESTIHFDEWRACPVGVALQLVLTRPEPSAFRTWFRERPDLPPAVAWSAAALCGLLHGHRRLDRHFRGDAFQRELLSILALRACACDEQEIDWQFMTAEAPHWRRDGGEFVLSWGGREFARKPEKARGKWFTADFDDAAVKREAQAVAGRMAWSCVHREIDLTDARFALSGSGVLTVLGDSERRLDVRGPVRMRVPTAAVCEEVLDVASFRRAVAVEAGTLPNPPAAQGHGVRFETVDVPGLLYVADFLSEGEEDHVVTVIDQSAWSSELQRRVQHHGWRYDYKARQIDSSMRLGPLPEWAARLARRLVSSGILSDVPDQVIVNEYVGNQGISRHVDSESSFADGIAMLSLLESWEMVFREKGKQGRKVIQKLERRSAAIMTGDARYRWTHEIPKRRHEPGRVKRGRRISLTFRKVLVRAVSMSS